MSAWIVDKSHLDLIVHTLAQGTRDGVLPPVPTAQSNADDLGQLLLDENVRSVAYRYSDDALDELPGPGDTYYLRPYRFVNPGYIATAAELAQALQCLDYQSCECPDYKDSEAYALNSGILEAIAERVPEYKRMRDGWKNKERHGYEWPEYKAAPWGFGPEEIAACIQKRAELCAGLKLDPSIPDAILRDYAQEKGKTLAQLTTQTKAEATAARREQERAKHLADNPHLTPRAEKPSWSPGRITAANLRVELKRAFPGVKFSIRSDYNSVSIHWECGPTSKAVDAICNSFKRGDFNGMEDIYEDNHDNTFADVFGGASYIFTTREYPDEGLEACRRQLAEMYDVPYTGRNTYIKEHNEYADIVVYRVLQEHPLPHGLTGLEFYHTEGIHTIAGFIRPVGALAKMA